MVQRGKRHRGEARFIVKERIQPVHGISTEKQYDFAVLDKKSSKTAREGVKRQRGTGDVEKDRKKSARKTQFSEEIAKKGPLWVALACVVCKFHQS